MSAFDEESVEEEFDPDSDFEEEEFEEE